jgi:hypothetical protein
MVFKNNFHIFIDYLFKFNKETTLKNFHEKMIPEIEKLEKAIKLYGQNGFAATNKMTWADLGIFLMVDFMKGIIYLKFELVLVLVFS